jgi:hypothetical protein
MVGVKSMVHGKYFLTEQITHRLTPRADKIRAIESITQFLLGGYSQGLVGGCHQIGRGEG